MDKDNEAIAQPNHERIFGVFGEANEVYIRDYVLHDFGGVHEEKHLSAWHQRLRDVVAPYPPDQRSRVPTSEKRAFRNPSYRY